MGLKYWDRLYRENGTSGNGSTGYLKAWKWRRIGEVHEVLDYGCGDLSFWEGLYEAPGEVHYTGVDVSPTIINRNMRARPGWSFYTVDEWRRFAGIAQRFDTVLCLDVLFHILDDLEYARVLDAIFNHSKRRVLIYTWGLNPFSRSNAWSQIKTGLMSWTWWRVRAWLPYLIAPRDGDGVYQKWRSIGAIFETANRWGFHTYLVYNAPDGLGVLIDLRKDRSPDYPPTGSGLDFPVGVDEGGREIG